MMTRRKGKVSFRANKKLPGQARAKITASGRKGAKRGSFLEGKTVPRRRRAQLVAPRVASRRRR